MSRPLIGRLMDGPLDVIGDVHGEIGPLNELLARLGYDENGFHPAGRHLVFVGDLCDRGPDSPAVIELVRSLVDQRLAQCLLGNHELNILRGVGKSGNRWFIQPTHREQQPGGEFEHCRVAPETLKSPWLKFFASLPLAFERDDLRIAHAAWVPGELDVLRLANGTTLELYHHYEARTLKQLDVEGVLKTAEQEGARWKRLLHDRDADVPLLSAVGEIDKRYQMGSPIRVVTSGVERLAKKPFWSTGQWRMCDRVRWWEEYQEEVPVIIGHYWRQAAPIASDHAASKPELFDDEAPTDWIGARSNVFCVDFSIGARYQERKAGVQQFGTHLAAMRWPERELWFETGKVTAAS